MAKPKHHKPAYRKQSGRDQAVVTLRDSVTGKRKPCYLGRYDSPGSHERYHHLVATWEARGRRLPDQPGEAEHRPATGPTVSRLIAEYLSYCDGYYVDSDGNPTSKPHDIKAAMTTLRALHGSTPAMQFGPKALREVRGAMLERDLARKTINGRIDHIRRMFKWAASHELVAASIHEALKTVPGLRKGEHGVRSGRTIKPAPEGHIEAIRPYVSDQIWALIQLQLLTAARGGELVLMRPMDLDRSGSIWLYEPASHKGEHRDQTRTIYIGPQAKAIIEPYLNRAPHQPLFSPAEAEAERRRIQHENRKTPAHHGNRPGTNRADDPKTGPGDAFTPDTYRRAIQRGCDRADIPRWHPHQLRHNAGTNLRREFGIEAARLILGHADANITAEVYAEKDEARAKEIIGNVG